VTVRRVPIGTVNVDALTEAQVVHRVRDTWQDGGWILTANVDIVRAISRNRDLVQLASTATLTVADGMPLVWAGRIAGQEIPERVTGSSLVHTLTQAAARDVSRSSSWAATPASPNARPWPSSPARPD
jgi:N-acetylglucosaminyldiphosphoundecaprenol N-acetyl-beta-D-mannosaminyltransferase